MTAINHALCLCLTLHAAPAQAAKVAKVEGCHGMSPFIRKLPYADYNNLWIVPIGHNLLFGVVASFVGHVLRQEKKQRMLNDYAADIVPHQRRTVIDERGRHLFVTSEFGRKYKSVLQYRGSYTMEDWLHFVLVFSSYVFGPGILPPLLEEMWDFLVTAINHYFHAVAGATYTNEGSEQAAAALLEYAKLVEKHMPQKCTYNLHVAVCR
jgi:hypothetical protein